MSCIVCDEIKDDYIKCYCEIRCCQDCLQQWIITNQDKDPSCVNCNRAFTQDQIYEILDPTFLKNEYIHWRSAFLFLKEKMYFISDMPEVALEISRRKQMDTLRKLYKQKKILIRKKKSDLSLVEQISDLKKTIPKPMFSKDQHYQSNKVRWVSMVTPCPKQGCRGYIVNPEYKCALCPCTVCKKCLQETGKEHKCDPEFVKTAKSILRETKPCPQCAVRIYQISGCDQMWCVCCHCTFSWKTGKKVNEQNHNPHYYQWLFSQGGALDGADCCDDRNFRDVIIRELYKKNLQNNSQICNHIIDITRQIAHVEMIDIPRYRIDVLKTNKDLRVKYLMNLCEQEDMERILYKREKMNLKKSAIYSILQTVTETLKDILYRYVVVSQTWNYQDCVKEIDNILDHAHEVLENIHSKYGGKILSLQNFIR